jgi:hypothetical protein
LDISVDELAARLEADLVYSKQFSNTTVDIIVLDSNATNATFTVREVVAAIVSIVADPNSRLRSRGYVQADSIQSISGHYLLCSDGTKRESCPSDDNDDDDQDLAIGLGVAAAVCVVVQCGILLLVLRQHMQQADNHTTSSHAEAGAKSGEAPAVELDETVLSPVAV